MAIGRHLVITVLLVEAALVVAAGAVLVAAAVVRTLRVRRRTPRLARARTQLVEVLGAAEPPETAGVVIRGLSRRERVAMFTGLAASMGGAGRNRLGALAADAGVLTRAHRMCRSLRWWRRLRGVRLFTFLGGGERVVPNRLMDRNAEVRAAAVGWVADHPDEALIQSVLGCLEDPRPLVRFAAKNTLLRIGQPTVDPLAAYLAERGDGRVDEAMEVAIGLAGPRLLPPVLRLAGSPSPRTRAGVATIAAAVGGENAVGAVSGLLDDPDSGVRAAAVAGLGKLGHWPAAPQMVSALGDPAWDVRRAAGYSLRSIGGPGILLLRRALENPDPFARDMARQVLDLPDTVSRQRAE